MSVASQEPEPQRLLGYVQLLTISSVPNYKSPVQSLNQPNVIIWNGSVLALGQIPAEYLPDILLEAPQIILSRLEFSLEPVRAPHLLHPRRRRRRRPLERFFH